MFVKHNQTFKDIGAISAQSVWNFHAQSMKDCRRGHLIGKPVRAFVCLFFSRYLTCRQLEAAHRKLINPQLNVSPSVAVLWATGARLIGHSNSHRAGSEGSREFALESAGWKRAECSAKVGAKGKI